MDIYFDPNKYDCEIELGNTGIQCIIATNSKYATRNQLKHAFQRAWQRGVLTDDIHAALMEAAENILDLAYANDDVENEKDEKTLLVKDRQTQHSTALSATWDRDGRVIFVNLITVVNGFKGSTRYPHQVECWVG